MEGIGKVEDFKRAMQKANVERVTLPASGITVLLCRLPVYAALALGVEGNELQHRVIDIPPDKLKPEDVAAFTKWVAATLCKLFVEPRFSATPQSDELGLQDILQADLQFIFRWLRGEVLPGQDGSPEDLETFRGGQEKTGLPIESGGAEQLPCK